MPASLAQAPGRPADPLVWLRRVHFDLIGLPPTPEECASFLSDIERAGAPRAGIVADSTAPTSAPYAARVATRRAGRRHERAPGQAMRACSARPGRPRAAVATTSASRSARRRRSTRARRRPPRAQAAHARRMEACVRPDRQTSRAR
ncbi:MAG: DUF1549 domain-containing protein [Phycisphaerales bacterium]